MHLANNSNNKFKTNVNTNIFSSLRIGQNDIYSTNDDEDDNIINNKEFILNSNAEQVKNDLYDYDDSVNITDFKF